MSRNGSPAGLHRAEGKPSAGKGAGAHPAGSTFAGRPAASGVRWTMAAVIARQGFQMLAALVLARILGPASYGIISAATVFTTFAALFLDQGLAAALVQRPAVSRRAAGATATLNLLMSVAIGVAALQLAPAVAGFFGAPELAVLLVPLAVAIPLKGLAITPRAMLSRELKFALVARADIAGAVGGAACGISSALLGAGYFALAYQVIATDLVTAALLLAAARGPWPNHHLREVLPMLAFSFSVFCTNFLAYFSRNMDNVLVGRFLGLASLSLYGMAYRIMVLPVQLVGQTINRVMFPVFSRASDDPAKVAFHLTSVTRITAMTAVPLMAYIASAAPELVQLVLGEAWLAAAPIISVLAIGGARETVFYITPTLMKGLGKGGLILRYEVLAALVQVGGIVVGLQFGLLGVAVGLVGAGLFLVPVLLLIQARLTQVRISAQLAVIWPAVHGALWGAAGCLGIGLLDLPLAATTALGLAVFLLLFAAVLFLCHRSHVEKFRRQAAALFGKRQGFDQ